MRYKSLVVMAIVGFVSAVLHAGLCQDKPSSTDLIDQAWFNHGKRDVENTLKYTQQVIELYGNEADNLQANLSALPKHKHEIDALQVLNDVATAYFIQAEVYMRQQDKESAVRTFQMIIDKYPYAHAWDQRGWFWRIAETAQQSIQKLQSGTIELDTRKPLPLGPETKVTLYDPGKEDFVDYAKYGEFLNAGTKDYQYIVTDICQ